jgi:hypothetical protein
MEGTRSSRRSSGRSDPKARRQAIIEYWRGKRCPRVGARELSQLQSLLATRFGGSAVDSPAAIARVLADEGAELRHPEVIECDAQWRAAFLQRPSQDSAEFSDAKETLTLAAVEIFIERLEELARNRDKADVQRLRSVAIEARKTAQLEARRKSLSESQRNEQMEIAEWLGVWIKTPRLFRDWLELRKRSAEFRRMFGSETL